MSSRAIEVIGIPTLKDNYVWAIINNNDHSALIVDPGVAEPVKAFLAKYQVQPMGILITHHHWDHTDGLHELKDQFHIPVMGPQQIKGVTQAVNHTVMPEHFPLEFKIIPIPGHTLEHIAYYTKGMVFCGDTLFAGGCGRVFEGTPSQMCDSLAKLKALPSDTQVFCGHEYTLNNLRFAEIVEPNNVQIKERIQIVTTIRAKNHPSLPSTIADELATNPFLRCEEPTVKAAAEKHVGHTLKNPVEVFATVRKWKDNF